MRLYDTNTRKIPFIRPASVSILAKPNVNLLSAILYLATYDARSPTNIAKLSNII